MSEEEAAKTTTTATTTEETKTIETVVTPEELKERGNKAFANQDFKEAIQHYTEAIQLDSKNHVFFSNRSASYAGLKQWKEAIIDAKECIRLNPQFMKGYYRLATAQLELEEFDLAQATIKQGLTLDANNSQLLKVLRTIKQEAKKSKVAKAAIASAISSTTTTTTTTNGGVVTDTNNDPNTNPAVAGVPPAHHHGKLDSATSRELYDLQLQHSQTTKEFQLVQANLSKIQREHKMQELTHHELLITDNNGSSSNETKSNNGEETSYYRTIGKVFVKSSRDRILEHLSSSMEDHKKKQVDMTQKLEYLERRLTSQRQNMEELASSAGDA